MFSVWGKSPGGGKVLLKLVGGNVLGGGVRGGDVQGEMSVTGPRDCPDPGDGNCPAAKCPTLVNVW